MEVLLTLRDRDVLGSEITYETTDYSLREASRAIITNELGCVALLKVGRYKHHKLPGGGIEQGENPVQALEREALEEIGCIVDITGQVGKIVEFRDQWKMQQVSYCYTAETIGESRSPSFTESERSDEFEILWVPDMDIAIATIGTDEPENYDGCFIQKRDLTFLKAAHKCISR